MNASEGKTKIIERIGNHQVLLHTKDNLTAGNAAKEAKINNIGEYKTEQAANVFSLLNSLNIPTAFIKKQDKNSLLCYACGMLPLEIVVRRYAFGSYLKRNPEMKKENGAIRFDEPIVEFFHKESVITPPLVEKACQMSEGEARSKFLHSGKWEEGVYADPLIIPKDEKWDLYDPYANLKDSKILMSINPELSIKDLKELKENIILPSFYALEKAWAKIKMEEKPITLVDIKFEVGKKEADGKIVLADVVDNDSWRIWIDGNPNQQLDKQLFRDGASLSTVNEKYKKVAELTKGFLIK